MLRRSRKLKYLLNFCEIPKIFESTIFQEICEQQFTGKSGHGVANGSFLYW